MASSAIPPLFPAVRVGTPQESAGWYFDGGPRLNTPIKPALWLGAERVVVIALNAVAPSRTMPPDDQPDFYVGAAHLLHAALGDPLAQDIRTLANRNALIAAGAAVIDRGSENRLAVGQEQPAGWRSRFGLCAISSSRPRTPRRSARSPGASTASATGASTGARCDRQVGMRPLVDPLFGQSLASSRRTFPRGASLGAVPRMPARRRKWGAATRPRTDGGSSTRLMQRRRWRTCFAREGSCGGTVSLAGQRWAERRAPS